MRSSEAGGDSNHEHWRRSDSGAAALSNTASKEAPRVADGRLEILKSGMLATAGGVVARLVTVPVGIYTATVLGRDGFGVLAVMSLVLQYLSYANLGMLANLTREVPMAYGRGEPEEATRIYSVVLTNYSFTTMAGVVVLWVAYLAGWDYDGALDIELMSILSVTVLAANAESYFYTMVKGEGRFGVLGEYEMIRPTAQALVQLVLVWAFGLAGLLMSMCVMHLLGLAFVLFRMRLPQLAWTVDRDRTITLLRTGFPMYVNKMLDSVYASAGVFIASWWVSPGELGVLNFALGTMAVTKVPFAQIFALAVNRNMAVQSGRSGEDCHGVFEKYLGSTYSLYLLLLGAGLGVLVLFVDVVTRIFLEEFRDALPILVVLYFALGFYNARVFLYAYINATRQMSRRLGITLVGLSVVAGMSALALWAGLGALGVAVAVGASMVVVTVHTVWIAFTQVFGTRTAARRFLQKLAMLSLGLTGGLVFLLWIAPPEPGGVSLARWAVIAGVFGTKAIVFGAACFLAFGTAFRSHMLHRELNTLARQAWHTVLGRRENETESRIAI